MLFWGFTKIDLIKLGFIVLVILLRRKSAWGPCTTDGTSYVGRRDGSEGLSFRAEEKRFCPTFDLNVTA